MHIPRIFVDAPLRVGDSQELNATTHHHLINVLRHKPGDRIVVFNGYGGEYEAVLRRTHQSTNNIFIGKFIDCNRESSLQLKLLQGISRGDHMDFCLQKAVELGVTEIQPIYTERCTVRIKKRHLQKKLDRWQKIITSATEQCGRTRISSLNTPLTLSDYFQQSPSQCGIVLDPTSDTSLSQFSPPQESISILVGPEGGLSEQEIAIASVSGLHRVFMGARTLRTETAAITAIAAVQILWGDLR
jgi:16S rRNA (uracil1498-N3)-methyltransferase